MVSGGLKPAPPPLVPAKAGTQVLALDSRFRGNERRMRFGLTPRMDFLVALGDNLTLEEAD